MHFHTFYRYAFLSILSLLLAQSVLAGPGVSPTEIDSLLRVADESESDSIRVLLWAQAAKSIAPTDGAKSNTIHSTIIELTEREIAESPKTTTSFWRNQHALALSSRGINHFLAGDYRQALSDELLAIDHYKMLENWEGVGKCYLVVGAIHGGQGNHEDALAQLALALHFNEKASNEAGIALVYNNMGTNYLALDSSAMALSYFQQSLAMYERLGDRRGMGVELLNIGSYYKKEKSLEMARDYFGKSLAIRIEIDDEQGQIFSYARLGQVNLELGNLRLAQRQGEKSLVLANRKGYPRGVRDANELLYEVEKALGNYEKALVHFEAFMAAKDSLASNVNIRKVAQLELSYQYGKQRVVDSLKTVARERAYAMEIDYQKAAISRQKKTATLLWIGVIAFFALAGVIFSRYRKINRQNLIIAQQKQQVETAMQQLSKSNEEKEILLKEIHHRVKNNLQIVGSLLDLQTSNIHDQTALMAVEDGQARVKAMALIHQNLYQNKDISNVSFEEYSRQLVKQLSSVYAPENDIAVNIKAEEIFFDIDTAIPLGLILNELISNAYKYAFQSTDGGELNVQLERESESFRLQVSDNGNGLPKQFEFEKATSLGLRLVRRLSRQLYGSTTYSYRNGSVFTVIFKDTLTRKAIQ